MPTNMEMRVLQKDSLFELLELKRNIGASDALDNLILKTKAKMEAEDVAYVEKMVSQLK